MRIAGRYGGETQEIVLHSGPSQDSGNKTQSDNNSTSTAAVDNSATPVPGPSNASSISSALRNVAQIIAAGI